MTRLTLYTTLGCHLCERLEAELVSLGGHCIQLERIEIADDDTLLVQYGERIPVLRDEQGSELERGFEPERLAAWLEARGVLASVPGASRQAPQAVLRYEAREVKGRRYLG